MEKWTTISIDYDGNIYEETPDPLGPPLDPTLRLLAAACRDRDFGHR